MMTDPGTYYSHGDAAVAAKEYGTFQRCLPQLVDPNEITGNLDGRWVIWKDGWVHGLASYPSVEAATSFAKHMFSGENASYIIVEVCLEAHSISPLHLLGDALSQLEFEGADEPET